MKFDNKRSTMAGPKRLLPVLMIVWLTTADSALCSRNAADPQTTGRRQPIAADRPKPPPLHPYAWTKRAAGSAVHPPPYAVRMEPSVHYSQQDPLYATVPSNGSPAAAKIGFGHDGGAASELLQSAASASYGAAAAADNGYGYGKEPEPIIEIIIKESNESLPAPPQPPPVPVHAKPPAKEPVQVFYVKYKKNPNSAYGDKEDDIIYEPPVPAITPASAELASESETAAFSTESSRPQLLYDDRGNDNSYAVTAGPPAPSTTYRTIIKPDSEVYHGTGLKVTFGKTEADWSPSSTGAAQKRDSAGEASEAAQNKVKAQNTDREFKRSFAQPAAPPQLLGDYQRNNNNNNNNNNYFEPNLPNTPRQTHNSAPAQQQQFVRPGQQQQVQNYFREDNPRPNFHGQIPVLSQPPPRQNHFEGAVEHRPNEFVDNFHNHQRFNRPPDFQQFPNRPNNVQQPQHPRQQFHEPPNHQQFNNPHQNRQQQVFGGQQPINHQQNVLNGPQNNQQFDGQQFNGQQQRRPADFQFHPSVRNPAVHFQDRPVHINGERPFVSKPFENHSAQSKPFENRPTQDRPFDHKPFESRPDGHFESRPFENGPFENFPGQNRPFDNQPVQSKPFENRPIFADRPFESRPIQNGPVENRPINDRPFDNRQNQGIVNYRPNKPPTPQNIPLNPSPSFTPNDGRPTVPPPQLPSNYNTQPISTKHAGDLAFSPHLQQQHQQFQQQFGPIENRPPANENPTRFRQPSIKQQQPTTSGGNISPISQYQQQSLFRQQQFNSETKPSSAPQVQITPSNGFQLQTLEPKQQPAQSGQFIDFYNRHSPTQTEKNSIRSDNIPWQISSQSQSSFKLEPQEYKDHVSASTTKNTIDTTSKTILKTTEKPAAFVTLQNKERSGSTSTVTPLLVATTEVPKNDTKKKTDLKNIASLPDEVPDELREQLLSSGILNNADIQILDYDKVGDIPIENLPPEALENLYGQGSAPVPSVVLPPNKSNVQMKVVKYDPSTEEGRKIENTYVDELKAETLDPVVLNDKGYNRFLPLNINGTHFPIPDSPLLKNKAIGSVVILSPVGYDLSDNQSRLSRNTAVKVKGVHFIVGDVVKNLVKEPNRKNFDIWLEKEKSTPPEEQSVVLLVTKPGGKDEKEIYMYDVAHDRVNKLSGDLSATFVDVAESNSRSHDLDNLSSDEEADVAVPGNGANDRKPDVAVSGYGKAGGDFGSGTTAAVATANH